MNDAPGRVETSNTLLGRSSCGNIRVSSRYSVIVDTAASWKVPKSSSYGTTRAENVSVSAWNTVNIGWTRSHTAGEPSSSSCIRNSSCRFTTVAIAQSCDA